MSALRVLQMPDERSSPHWAEYIIFLPSFLLSFLRSSTCLIFTASGSESSQKLSGRVRKSRTTGLGDRTQGHHTEQRHLFFSFLAPPSILVYRWVEMLCRIFRWADWHRCIAFLLGSQSVCDWFAASALRSEFSVQVAFFCRTGDYGLATQFGIAVPHRGEYISVTSSIHIPVIPTTWSRWIISISAAASF